MTKFSPAQILAFLYAGALAFDQDRDKFEEHEGHRGFVAKCEPIAARIADHLNSPVLSNVVYDGVIEYEVIEPLGKWILDNPDLNKHDAFTRFCEKHRTFLVKEDRGLTVVQLMDKSLALGELEYGMFTHAMWRAEVGGKRTISGYWDWVHQRVNGYAPPFAVE